MSSLDFYKPLHSLLTDIVTFYTKFFTCEGEHFWPSVVTEEIEATKFSYLALCVSLHIDLFFFFPSSTQRKAGYTTTVYSSN